MLKQNKYNMSMNMNRTKVMNQYIKVNAFIKIRGKTGKTYLKGNLGKI